VINRKIHRRTRGKLHHLRGHQPVQRLLWLWRQVETGSHENRIGTRCGLVNFALDGRQKRTRSLFGPLLETSSKHTSRAWLSRSELQANQLARAFLACRSGRDRGWTPALFVLNKEKKRLALRTRPRALAGIRETRPWQREESSFSIRSKASASLSPTSPGRMRMFCARGGPNLTASSRTSGFLSARAAPDIRTPCCGQSPPYR
jgi:hypothetical protein